MVQLINFLMVHNKIIGILILFCSVGSLTYPFFLINFPVRTEWSLELEGELLSLVEEIPPKHYTRLCNALGVQACTK